MSGLFGDPWSPSKVVEPDLLKLGVDQVESDQTPDEFATIAYVNALISGFQPHDTDLDAIAALSTTSFGRSLLALADSAALQSLIGLVVGTDVQAHDSDLDAIAALSTTSFGRSLLALVDAAALRSAAGLAIGTNVEAWDADLDAIAGLTGTVGLLRKTAANTWTLDTSTFLTSNQAITLSGDVSGSGTTAIAVTIGANKVTRAMLAATAGAALLGATAAGNVSDLSPATVRTMLSLVVGTDVQAHDSDLDAIAALSTTSFGRSLLALADASALRSAAALAAIAASGSASDLSTGTVPQARIADYQCGNMEFHLKITGLFLSTQQITNVTTVASTADRYQVHPWTPSRDVVIQNIGVEVTTLLAGSNAKVVVHDTDPTTGGPNNVLFETANLSCAAVGYVSETRSFTFQKGVTYWVGVRTSSTQSLRAYTQTAARNIGQTIGTGIPQNALQKTLTFTTAAPAWGTVTTGQFVGGNPLAVLMQLA